MKKTFLILLGLSTTLWSPSTFAASGGYSPGVVLEIENKFRNLDDSFNEEHPELADAKAKASQCFADSAEAIVASRPTVRKALRDVLDQARKSPRVRQLNPNPNFFTLQLFPQFGEAGLVPGYNPKEAHAIIGAISAIVAEDILQDPRFGQAPSCEEVEKDPKTRTLMESKQEATWILAMSILRGVERAVIPEKEMLFDILKTLLFPNAAELPAQAVSTAKEKPILPPPPAPASPPASSGASGGGALR